MYHNTRPLKSSSPIHNKDVTYNVKEIPAGLSFNVNDFLDQTGDSTRSLLAPVFASNYAKEEKGNLEDSDAEFNSEKELRHSTTHSINSENNKDEKEEMKDKPESIKSAEIKDITQRSSDNSPSYQRKTNSSSSISSSSSSSSISSSSSSCSSSTTYSAISKQQIVEEFNGKSWDEWLREKLVNDMQKLQLKREKRHHLREEKKRLQVERCRKEEIANENRKEWLQKKVFKLEKERREKVAQTEFEKLKKQQEKELTEEKSKQRYDEWYAMKRAEEKAKKRKLRQEKQAIEQEKINKQEQAEKAYKTWLRKSRKVGTPHSQAINGSLLQYLHKDKPAAASPSYINPIPWVVGTSFDEPANARAKKLETYSSPPLLWKEIEHRDNRMRSEPKTKKKHCVGKRVTSRATTVN